MEAASKLSGTARPPAIMSHSSSPLSHKDIKTTPFGAATPFNTLMALVNSNGNYR